MMIGNIDAGELLLAPMAGVTHLPFRMICRESGCGLCCTEMVSAKGIVYKNENTGSLLATGPGEYPAAVQLFGSEPDSFSYAVKYICDNISCAAIDINMGCPMKKIVGGGDGSALMREPLKAAALMNAAVKASSLPVTVKIRSGYTAEEKNAAEIARIAESEGISAVTVHGKTREQMYRPPVDFDIIAQVKAAVNIPVIGNGEIETAADAADMREKTGCDGIMIGRGCLGKPWVFAEIVGDGVLDVPLSSEQIYDTIIKHIDLTVEIKEEKIAAFELRKHLSWYIKDIRNAAYYRGMINKTTGIAGMKDIIRQCFQPD